MDGLFSWMVFVENRTPKECDNEEQGREVYLPERDDGICNILRGITKEDFSSSGRSSLVVMYL